MAKRPTKKPAPKAKRNRADPTKPRVRVKAPSTPATAEEPVAGPAPTPTPAPVGDPGTEDGPEGVITQEPNGGSTLHWPPESSRTLGVVADPPMRGPDRYLGSPLAESPYPQAVRYTPPPPKIEFMPLEMKLFGLTIFRAKVYGGPYRDRNRVEEALKTVKLVGVKMAEEINEPCSINVPTRDFSVPNLTLLMQGLYRAEEALVRGETLYVGCMGGTGRTGLFMASLAKMFGQGKDGVMKRDWKTGQDVPVERHVAHVRATYRSHAVETELQEAFIRDLDVTRMRLDLRTRLFWRWVFRGFRA